MGVQARAFFQSELPRKPPIDTHGRYTCIQYMHGGTKERRKKKKKKKKKEKKKVGRSEKVGKTASLLLIMKHMKYCASAHSMISTVDFDYDS